MAIAYRNTSQLSKLIILMAVAPSPHVIAIGTRVGPTCKSLCAQIAAAATTHVPYKNLGE